MTNMEPVLKPGTFHLLKSSRVRHQQALDSFFLKDLSKGSIIVVDQYSDNGRCHITSPLHGWITYIRKNNQIILEPHSSRIERFPTRVQKTKRTASDVERCWDSLPDCNYDSLPLAPLPETESRAESIVSDVSDSNMFAGMSFEDLRPHLHKGPLRKLRHKFRKELAAFPFQPKLVTERRFNTNAESRCYPVGGSLRGASYEEKITNRGTVAEAPVSTKTVQRSYSIPGRATRDHSWPSSASVKTESSYSTNSHHNSISDAGSFAPSVRRAPAAPSVRRAPAPKRRRFDTPSDIDWEATQILGRLDQWQEDTIKEQQKEFNKIRFPNLMVARRFLEDELGDVLSDSDISVVLADWQLKKMQHLVELQGVRRGTFWKRIKTFVGKQFGVEPSFVKMPEGRNPVCYFKNRSDAEACLKTCMRLGGRMLKLKFEDGYRRDVSRIISSCI